MSQLLERNGRRFSADDGVQLFPTESPQYNSLAAAISHTWTAVRTASRTLRRRWFDAAGLTDPAKGTKRLQAAALDEAIETFLREMAGADRGAVGFASSRSEDGLIQQMNFLAHRVGVARAVELTSAPAAASGPLTDRIRERLSAEAFARLSEDGRLRFESRLGEIKQAMLDGLERGDSPVTVARTLGEGLDGYERGRLLTITRTEMGIASEAGARQEYKAQGVTLLEVVGNELSDSLCAEHIGNQYGVDDLDNLPIYHPSCLCATVPVVAEEG